MNPSGIICLRHEEHGLAGDGLEGVLEQVVQPALQVVHMHGPPLLDLGHHHLREEGDQERAVSTQGLKGARRGSQWLTGAQGHQKWGAQGPRGMPNELCLPMHLAWY